MTTNPLAPDLAVSQWFNTDRPLDLGALRGRVVYMHTFQLLCPGCVLRGIPQAQRVERIFARSDLQVIGLHTVFEHHAAMTPVTLKAFIHEYGLTSPVGVDMAGDDTPVPVTMQRYGLQGTPSSVLIGRDGRILHRTFGVEDDILVGARIAQALAAPVIATAGATADGGNCADGVCALPA